jgi:DNA primase
MGGIPEHLIDEVRQRADVVEVIGSYLQLKKAGSNYRALCPFHSEKSPSFNVNPAKQIFHCFGCGVGGNVFSFLMKYEGLTFPDAVRRLAERYNVTIVESDGGRRDQYDKLYSAMEAATTIYQDALKSASPDSPIIHYLKGRGLHSDIVKKFRLGWAPDEWDYLITRLGEKGYDAKTVEAAGLSSESKKGPIDRFRGRLIFPIINPGGKVIAFGGRIIGNEVKAAKYLNSPETPIYHKSAVLYGFHEGTQSARRKNELIVAEGYMDAIALSRSGFENAAAVCGVALTEKHADLVRRVSETVVLMFDADDAGITAVKRSGPVLARKGINVKVALLPGAKDPDEYLKSNPPERLSTLIETAPSYPRFVIDHTLARFDLSVVEERLAAVTAAMDNLSYLTDEIAREEYSRYLAHKAGVDPSAVNRQVARRAIAEAEKESYSPPPVYRGEELDAPPEQIRKKPAPGLVRIEKILLAIILAHPAYIKGVAAEICPADFSEPIHKSMYTLITKAVESGCTSVADIVGFGVNVEDEPVRDKLVALSMERGLFDVQSAESAVRDYVARLKYDAAESESSWGRLNIAARKFARGPRIPKKTVGKPPKQ